jgi:20S proteasome alpha/beta subunit
MEAIGQAGAALGALAKDGVALVAEKKITSKVLCANHKLVTKDQAACHVLI